MTPNDRIKYNIIQDLKGRKYSLLSITNIMLNGLSCRMTKYRLKKKIEKLYNYRREE